MKESSVFEIVELGDGEFALARVDGTGEPLVCIKFSEESLDFLKHTKIEVAKAMIEAGLDAAVELSDELPEPGTEVLH